MIRVKDIDASLKFYTEVLDMTLDHKKRLDDCWLYFLNDKENTCQIELTYNDETPECGYEIGGYVGTSIGSFNAAVLAQGDFKKLYDKWYDGSAAIGVDIEEKEITKLISKKIDKINDIKVKDIPEEIEKLTALMKIASKNLDFEKCIEIREKISALKKKLRF